MHSEWKDFLFDDVRCNCSMCKHCEVDATATPCNTCLVNGEVNGTQFVPANQEYFDALKKTIDQHYKEYFAALDAVDNVRSKIRETADSYGVNMDDFYYAISNVSPRRRRKLDES